MSMPSRYAWTGTVLTTIFGLAVVGAAAQDRSGASPDQQQQKQPPPIQARPGSPDTTPESTYQNPVAKGSRLVLNNNAGEVVIRAWDQDQLKIEASHSSHETLDVQENESTVRVRTRSKRGARGLVDYKVWVPRWMPVNLSGTYLDADVEGTSAEVTVETVGGNVRVSGGSGAVSLRSVEGTITVEKTTGRVQASAVNEGIELTNTQGEVIADSINGDVTIDNAQTSSLEVSTVNGDVTFNGTVRDSGVYRLTTHGGDIRVGLGGAANAIVFVRTFQGSFSADFPIQLPEGQTGRSGSKRFNFTLGSGSARIEVQSFSGDIHLARTRVISREEERRQRRTRRPGDHDFAWNFEGMDRLSREAMEEASRAMRESAEAFRWRAHERAWDAIDPDEINEEIQRSLRKSLESLREHGFISPPLPPRPPGPPSPPAPPKPPK